LINDAASSTTESPAPQSARRTALVLALLTLLAAALRFWRLGDWSMWADEVATLRDAQHLHDVITYPVGYALIGFVVKLLGSDEFSARLAPAVVGVVSVPAIYLVGRRIFSERAAVLSAVLLAVSSYHIFFSQFARYYALLMLLGMLGMWCAFVGLERNSWKGLVGAVLLLGLAVWTHWTAALALPALAVYAVWCWRSRDKPAGLNWPNLALLFAPFIAGAIVMAPSVMSFLGGWRAKTGFSFGRSALTALKVADGIHPAVILCAAVGAWLLLRQRDRRGKWLLCYAAVPALIVVIFVGFAEGGRRFAIIALPAFLLLAGEGLDLLIRHSTDAGRKVAWALVGLVVLSLGLQDAFYFTVERGQRPRWREAAEYVLPKAREAPAWIMASAPEVMAYYAQQMGITDFEHPSSVGPQASKLTATGLGGIYLDSLKHWPTPVYVIVEHVPNVAPTDELMEFLKTHGTLEKTFLLRVRFLDYSLSVYRVPAAGPS